MATRSVYQSPAVEPAEMTEEEQAQFSLAQVAMIAAAAGAQKKAISDSITLALVPMLQGMNMYDPVAIARFAKKAAEQVEFGRQEQARITWAAVHQRMMAYGENFPAVSPDLGRPSRATDLEVAYERPVAAYRRRMAAGTDSIKKLIAEVEEQRFIDLGGTTEENNAEEQAPSGAEGKKPSSDDKSKSGDGKSDAASGESKKPKAADLPGDPEPDAEPSDFDFVSPEEAERQAEDQLREQARLSEDEQNQLLEEKALEDAEERLERMINDDIAMAKRDAHQMAMKKAPARVIGVRRVIHPELAETGITCGLCIAASTMIYKRDELMPIHNLCNCEPVEVLEDADPGQQINDEDLLTLYEEAGQDGQISTGGRDLKKTRYEVYDHPELGPILVSASSKRQVIEFSKREPKASHKVYQRKQQEKRAEKFGR